MTSTTHFIQTPIGILRIHADEIAIRAVLFENNKNYQEENSAPIEHPLVKKCVSQLTEYFDGKRMSFDLPIDQTGTPFQQTVWKELEQIGYGKTISYHELSKRVGNTRAIRAVGTTNGKNQLAIIVPCHRVIGSDGSLTGYAGELWRKKWLLEHEAKFANGVQTLF